MKCNLKMAADNVSGVIFDMHGPGGFTISVLYYRQYKPLLKGINIY